MTDEILENKNTKQKLSDEIGKLKKIDERNYGGKVISIYTY